MYLPCPCGKQLRVNESHVGRTVRCPGCGTPHVVRAAPPTASPAGHTGVAPPSGLVPMLARLAAILLLIGGVGTAGWWALRPGVSTNDEDGPDGDAELIAILRPAELWAIPQVRAAVGDAPDGPVERFHAWTGLRPEQVERFKLVAYRPAERVVWAVVRTVEPFDPAGFERLPVVRRGVFARRPFVVVATPQGERALAAVGPRVLVVGDEESLKTALSLRARREPPGPLEALAVAATGHHAAVGISPSPGWRDQMVSLALPGFEGLGGVRAGTLVIDIAERTTLTATAELNGQGREQAVRAIKRAQGLAAVGALAGDPLLEMLANADLMEDGDAVRLRADGETGAVLRALAGWGQRAGW